MKVLTLDPAGNFGGREGYGHTGFAIFENKELKDFGSINADDYSNQELYWESVGSLITKNGIETVICEGYRLYSGTRGKAQINSSLDTPQLIGYIRMICWHRGITYIIQPPSDKTPVNDERLVRANIFEKKGNKHYCMGRPTNLHARDAIRHGIYFYKFGRGKNDGEKDRI